MTKLSAEDIALETLAVAIFASAIPRYAARFSWDQIEIAERVRWRATAKSMVEESIHEEAIAARSAYIAMTDYQAAALRADEKVKKKPWFR